MADGGVAMPEAVACANASMAEALIRTLQKHGIAVPEEVAVVGYDPFMTNVLNVPRLPA
ncbi:MAG: substrate-binding domain-containing protein [Ruminococcus sp.]